MDQQNNPAVPRSATDKGQPQQWAPEEQARPAPVWEGTPQGNAAHPEPQGWDAPPGGHKGGPSRGWGAPGQSGPAWGTTPAAHQGADAGTGWGAPLPYSPQAAPGTRGKRTWTAKKGVAAGGVAVVVAAAAGAGAYAAGNGSIAAAADGQAAGAQSQFGPGSQSRMPGPGGAAGGMDGGPSGLGMGMGGLNAAIHSEYVILQDAGYVTMAGQTGTVTGISRASLTVKSDDGFTCTYAAGSDVQISEGMRQRGSSAGSTLSLTDVTAGASVRITAVKETDSYKAQSIQLAVSGRSATPNSGTSTTPNPGTTTN